MNFRSDFEAIRGISGVDTIGHVSDDIVRHVSDKTLGSDIPLMPLDNISPFRASENLQPPLLTKIITPPRVLVLIFANPLYVICLYLFNPLDSRSSRKV